MKKLHGSISHRNMINSIKKTWEAKGDTCQIGEMINVRGCKQFVDLFCQKSTKSAIIECGRLADRERLYWMKKEYPRSHVLHYPQLTQFLDRKSKPNFGLTESERQWYENR